MSTISTNPIKIAILAVGGDGGGVLTKWIVTLAENNGFLGQSTTIAGVAQRTGSTVYYIELFPFSHLKTEKNTILTPVLAQMPEQGNIDIVIATEIMEAGRAIQRNFVSNNTSLIFSTHRSLAIREKEIPGDGIIDGKSIFELAIKYSDKCIYNNFKLIADKNNSVISASLFGALASGNLLPFEKEKFEETIKNAKVAVITSLNAFNEAFENTKNKKDKSLFSTDKKATTFKPMPIHVGNKKYQKLIEFITEKFPKRLHPIIYSGVKNLVEWQNVKWAKEYLNILEKYSNIEKEHLEYDSLLLENIARYLSLAMSYDDIINVADIKTRSERWNDVYKQVEAKESDVVKIVDYLHPRFDEFVGFLPKKIGLKTFKKRKSEKMVHKIFR